MLDMWTRRRVGGRSMVLVGVAAVISATLGTPPGAPAPVVSAAPAIVTPGCVIDTTGMIGWWRGQDELTAVVGPDLTGGTGHADSVVRRGFDLDATAALTADSLPVLSTGITVEAWIRPDLQVASDGQVQVLLSRWDEPTTDDISRSYALRLDPFGVLMWTTDDVTTRRPLEVAAAVPQLLDGQAHHVAATWSPTEAVVYVDGIEVANAPSQGGLIEPAPHVPFRVGRKGGLGSPFAYVGVIDEPAVFSRALAATEVAAIAAAGAAGKCAPVASRTRVVDQSPVSGDGFGYRVAIDGDTIAVGTTADEAGIDSGSVVVVTRSATGWTAGSALVAADTVAGDGFGDAVALDGDTLVVGAPFVADLGAGAGAAYVFERGASGWVQQAKLVGADTAMLDGFGSSVAVHGDTVVVGAPGADDSTGSVYVFTRSGTSWSQQAAIRPADAEPVDLFGASVALDGDTVVIGAPNDTTTVPFGGSARVFARSAAAPTTWAPVAVLVAPAPAPGDFFGWSVALHERRAVVGAQRANGAAGVAHVFRDRSISGVAEWVHDAALTAADPEGGDLFGISVSLGSDTAVVGAVWDDDNGGFSGTVWTFRRSGESWTRASRPISDSVTGDRTGSSVAFAGDTMVVGSPGATAAGVTGAGAIDVIRAP